MRMNEQDYKELLEHSYRVATESFECAPESRLEYLGDYIFDFTTYDGEMSVLFDVNVGQWWLQRNDVEDVAQKLGVDVVPVIGDGTLHDAVAQAKAGILSTWGDFQAEGIVARPKTELKTRNGHRIITKIKCRDFAGSNVEFSGGAPLNGAASAGT